jgi:hypothetical protein
MWCQPALNKRVPTRRIGADGTFPTFAHTPPAGADGTYPAPGHVFAGRIGDRNYDWTQRFGLIREAVEALRARSCLIDGEAIAFERDGNYN